MLSYRYDGLGRLASVEVGHYDGYGDFEPGYPSSLDPPGEIGSPPDRAGFVEYGYDAAGSLRDVVTWTARDAQSRSLITQVRHEVDGRGSLVADWQSYGLEVNDDPQQGALTPRVEYGWSYAATAAGSHLGGHLRLSSMTYPPYGTGDPREVGFDYGTPGGASDLLSRVSGLTTNLGTASVAAFEHVGSGRRAGLTLAGGAIAQGYRVGSEVGLGGLDGFGRVSDLRYVNADTTPATLFRAEYT